MFVAAKFAEFILDKEELIFRWCVSSFAYEFIWTFSGNREGIHETGNGKQTDLFPYFSKTQGKLVVDLSKKSLAVAQYQSGQSPAFATNCHFIL